MCAPDNARPLAPLSPQITCAGLSVPPATFSPPSPLCFPSICGGAPSPPPPPFPPPSLWGRISLPSFPPSSSICGRIPSHCHCQPPVRRCILSRLTLPRLPQWRYECFSDVINTHSGGKAGPKIFSRKFLEFPPVLAPPPRCRGRASKPDFSSSNFHRPPSRGAQYFFVACYGSVNQTVK